MENILIPGTFMSVLLSVLLLSKTEKRCADYILSAFLLLSALVMALAYMEVYNRANNYPYPLFISLSPPFVLLLGPAIWLYVKCLTVNEYRLKTVHILLIVPFLLVFSLFLFGNYILPYSQRVAIDSGEVFKDGFLFPLVVTMIACSNIGYTLWGLFLIKRFREREIQPPSGESRNNLKWLRFLLMLSLICYAAISVIYIADSVWQLMSYNFLQISGLSVASLFVIVLGFFGLKQGDLFSAVRQYSNESPGNVIGKKMDDTSEDDREFIKTLLLYMGEKKPYLDPYLTLDSLSRMLRITPEYLSGVLNGTLGHNFYDFVNHYRIEEFKLYCKDPAKRKLTIIALALDSGFNSKATFNRVFKKRTGLTPSEYFNKVSTL